MKNSSSFNINFESISQFLNSVFSKLNKTSLKLVAKSGKQYASLPLIIALIITCILPFLVIAGVIIALILDINIIFEHQVDEINKIEN